MELSRSLTIELQRMPSWAKNILIVVGASIVLGLFANLAIPLPFTPVALVTQSGVVLLLAALLGSKRAPAAVALFLAQGAMGLPVFANGAGGFVKLIGPSGGYLLGYFVAAYVTAKIIEMSEERSLTNALVALTVGTLIILCAGGAWLASYVGASQAFVMGILPFLLGDLFKVAAILKILHWMGWGRP
jgi:biotin transport system substrate-specific component